MSDNESESLKTTWDVHKFGGTSVGNAKCMRQCIEIIKPLLPKQRIAVVVSAIGGSPKVTDLLLDLVYAAANNRNQEIIDKMKLIYDKHKICIDDILKDSVEISNNILNQINSDLRDISDLLRAVSLMKTPHEQILELVSGYGEVWSATIISEALRQEGFPFIFLNARDVLIVSEDELGTKVHWDISEEKLNKFLLEQEILFNESEFGKNKAIRYPGVPTPNLLITGYIATSLTGISTTLKRDGSDFSASIFGKMLKASGITIWTDVSGVYSADPRRVSEAQIISDVSYTEAIELAYFGAKVIHPKTMAPAILDKIPIYIRNTFAPSHPGTKIFLPPIKGQVLREHSVCGFTTVDGIALLNIEGTGMIGVPGIAHRLFGALKAANISVMFIAQASSEYSICFATKEIHVESAKKAISEAFFYELKQGLISNIRIISKCAIIAAVGESMSNTPGVSGIFFGALGDASVNILSISQGCDERNISAVVYASEATKALRAVHSAFLLSSLDITIGIVGTGRVGSAVILSLLEQVNILNSHFGLNIRIRGITNSKKMLLGDNLIPILNEKLDSFFPIKKTTSYSIDDDINIETTMKRSRSSSSLTLDYNNDPSEYQNSDLDVFFNYMKSGTTPHVIIIDATSSDYVASLHPQWLKGLVHVVTANKRAIANSLELYNSVYSSAKEYNRMYMSQVTIGASLPIRTTLYDMLSSGDAVYKIVGLMSVSVGVILNELIDNGLSFTEALVKTYRTGLLEDDVFADLEGTEAAQKLLLLARELGVPMSLNDIEIEPIAIRRTIDSWDNLNGIFDRENDIMAEKCRLAKEKGCTLRYVQRIECNPPAELGNRSEITAKASVRLEEVPLDSQYAMVKGAVYYFAFHTDRYSQTPLVIQGPLSDSANTASGIIGDILRIAKSIGAKGKATKSISSPLLNY